MVQPTGLLEAGVPIEGKGWLVANVHGENHVARRRKALRKIAHHDGQCQRAQALTLPSGINEERTQPQRGPFECHVHDAARLFFNAIETDRFVIAQNGHGLAGFAERRVGQRHGNGAHEIVLQPLHIQLQQRGIARGVGGHDADVGAVGHGCYDDAFIGSQSTSDMRIISLNANGIRSAATKGVFDWLREQNADVICLQETKAQEDQLTDPMFRPDGHHCFYRDASTKKGYSGVAIYAKREPDQVLTELGWDAFDNEGRYIEARFGNLSVVSLYVPSGSSGDERQQFKFKVMEWLTPIFDQWLKSGRDYVICGDWNIVHTKNDIKNWSSNQKNSGCLPEERAWLDLLFQQRGWVDSFRALKPDTVEYTWWSNRGQARANNVGWRIDYQVATPSLRERMNACSIYRDQRFSDHAPYTVDYAD